jgi:hypothetical protein
MAQISIKTQPRAMASPPAAAAERSPGARSRSSWRRIRGPGLAGLLLMAPALAGGAALASSPEAWRAYDRQVRAACVAASGLTAVSTDIENCTTSDTEK